MADTDHPDILRNVAAAMLVLSWMAVILRVYVRAWLIRVFGADDWFAVATLGTFTVHCIFVFIGLTYRPGVVDSQLALHQLVEALKWWWAASLPYIICTALIKWAVGIFLLRFCRSRVHTWIIYAVLGIVTLYNIAYLFVCIFQCLPVGHFWLQFEGQKGSCMSRHVLTNLSYAAAALNAAGDCVLGILPVFLVRKLQMSFRTKVSVAAVLALGSISCLSTIIRLPYLVTLLSTVDFLAATTPVAIWGLVELGLGLIAASTVTLKPLIVMLLTGRRPYNSRSKPNSYPLNYPRNELPRLGVKKGARTGTESDIELAMDVSNVAGRDDLQNEGRD